MDKQQAEAVKALEQAVALERAARDAVDEAQQALAGAQVDLGAAIQNVREKQLARDAFLPKCTICVSKYYGRGHVVDRHPGVIVRRTAKEIVVRNVGAGEFDEQRYRQSKATPERWNVYPAEKGFRSTVRWVELGDEKS